MQERGRRALKIHGFREVAYYCPLPEASRRELPLILAEKRGQVSRGGLDIFKVEDDSRVDGDQLSPGQEETGSRQVRLGPGKTRILARSDHDVH